ncbi:intradiol ring-cleavage dioxygenase [Nocardiopsis sp. N85]|uniref:intradiol ring-cleavage dioxygenase n=1 Tax=Nocardiopsis sp. N85 TaxID=3029400 RepID=UPI00237F31A4|nr:intradiol ring-cleavage dioxygenase [Nocardiopsis sp. N85]MDE3720468.1 intradiol ring-cleavage dioxygenase [Nocardiopsis sp. N85]
MAEEAFRGPVLDRRRAIVLGGGAVAVGVAGCAGDTAEGGGTAAGGSTPSPGATDQVCVLSPEVTEGPYHLDGMLVREDITEGKQGFPLELAITVVDFENGCAPLTGEGVAVEIWHCDAWGYYSGYTDASPGGEVPAEDGEGDEQSFLRGIQPVDEEGTARFTTIVPGWYSPRVTHVHLKVHTEGEIDTTYEGGTTVHTGQLLFADAFCAEVAEREPYSEHVLELTPVEEDQVFQEAQSVEGDPDSMVVTPVAVTEGTPEDGYTLTVVVGVTMDESAGGGGGGAPEGGGEGGGTPPEGGPDGGSPPEGGTPPAPPEE